MFFDEVRVRLRAGDGGEGCVSFRREKFIPHGGPDGGDGGKGGDIVLVGDENAGDLREFHYRPDWKAKHGEGGQGRDRNGIGGADAELHLPLGTFVISQATGKPVAEILTHGERIVLLQGGRGGLGNLNFKNSINQAPRKATPGQAGEEGQFILVLKSIADVGLVGFPNAGKSSLINLLTNVHAKTAPYPFTTLGPNVGVIEYPEHFSRLKLADIPGLIAGASENRGLGHRFLRHIERCAMLVLIVDMAGTDGRSPVDDYRTLLAELKAYSPALLEKSRLVVANKMDVAEAAANLKDFKRRVRKVPVQPLSCLTGEGLAELKANLWTTVRAIAPEGGPRPALADAPGPDLRSRRARVADGEHDSGNPENYFV